MVWGMTSSLTRVTGPLYEQIGRPPESTAQLAIANNAQQVSVQPWEVN
jgi:hypothetical protein